MKKEFKSEKCLLIALPHSVVNVSRLLGPYSGITNQ